MIYWPAKGTGEIEDFTFDFTDALETSETISTKVITATGVTVQSSSIVDVDGVNAAGVQVWLSGGAVGTPGVVDCTITTSVGRTYTARAIVLIGEEPVSIVEAKAQVRMTNDDSEDVFIASLLMPARAYVERVSRYFFVAAGRTETFGAFGDYLELYRRPIASVDSIFYGPVGDDTDTEYTGAVAPVGRFPLRIYPAADASFPDLNAGEVITVNYTSGSLSPESEEYLIGKRAMLLLIGYWFDNREAAPLGTASGAVEFAVNSLLDELRLVTAY